jgi:hypothetical protein
LTLFQEIRRPTAVQAGFNPENARNVRRGRSRSSSWDGGQSRRFDIDSLRIPQDNRPGNGGDHSRPDEQDSQDDPFENDQHEIPLDFETDERNSFDTGSSPLCQSRARMSRQNDPLSSRGRPAKEAGSVPGQVVQQWLLTALSVRECNNGFYRFSRRVESSGL